LSIIDRKWEPLSNVKHLRNKQGLSIQELALKANVCVGTIKRMEDGNNISLESACNVANALGEEVHILFPAAWINPNQGRPTGTGTPKQRHQKKERKAVYCLNAECGMELSSTDLMEKGCSNCGTQLLQAVA